jgi:multidrug efflux pump subunit AcrA (membrane-fusion protein)
MRRPPTDHTADIGSDSFLDVVTNIVGILIILVMVVGMRAKNAPLESAESANETDIAAAAETESLFAEGAAVEADIHRLHRQALGLEQELALQDAGRNQLAVIITMAEKELDERKAQLDDRQRQQFEQQAQLATARSDLAEIERQAELAAVDARPAVEVKAFPTPISKTVYGKEVHFQLSDGHVAYIPIEELFELARDETRAHMTRVTDLDNRVLTVGPKQGFEMHFTIDVIVNSRQGQMAVRSKEWQVVPVQARLGEAADEALGAGSNFRRVLAQYSPKDTTVTIWTYPDSFGEYRTLNEALHRLGYAAAGRPLPEGFPIGGSPHGSKSAAQ